MWLNFFWNRLGKLELALFLVVHNFPGFFGPPTIAQIMYTKNVAFCMCPPVTALSPFLIQYLLVPLDILAKCIFHVSHSGGLVANIFAAPGIPRVAKGAPISAVTAANKLDASRR